MADTLLQIAKYRDRLGCDFVFSVLSLTFDVVSSAVVS